MSRNVTFFDYVCSNADKFALLLAFECLAGLFSVVLFLGSKPGTAPHVVSVLNIVGASVLGIATAAILVKCYRT